MTWGEETQFKPGNKAWEARSSHGRNPLFASGDDLWNAATEYFQWVEDNPLQEEKLFSYQGEIVKGTVNKMRAMTISGLCLYLDIAKQTWCNYREHPDFMDTAARIDDVIRDQKFSGAAADLLNSNIIARDLGLKESTSSEVTLDSKSPVINLTLSNGGD